MNMHSPLPDDRTSRARIRDEAIRLFAERGADAVTVRDIAAAADVSPALILRHYVSKDGLRNSVDEHVARVFEAVLDQVVLDQMASTDAEIRGLTESVSKHLPADSPIPAYLGRILLTGGPVGSPLFARLHEVSRKALDRMADAGTAVPGDDPDVRAAYLLVADLAVLILRDRLREVLGVDPLSTQGMARWGNEVLAIHRNGLNGGRS